MNAQLLAKRAYSQKTAPTRTSRGTEYEVFAAITSRLNAAARLGKRGFPQLAGAIHDNRKLWMLLASDVADGQNALPEELRARIFYLSEFTRVHSGKVLREGVSPVPLIEINAAMMRGLRGQDRRP